jgi:hypothetical protein
MAVKYWISTSSTSFNTAANWSDGNAPANSDTLVFNHLGTASVLTNLGTILTGVILIKEKTYTGSIGVLTGATATYLVLDGGTLIAEQNTGSSRGSGSPLLMVNFGSTAAVATIYDSASTSSTTYYPPILIKGTSLTVNHLGGKVGIAALTGETATTTAVKVSQGDNPSVSPSLYLGKGTTVTALTAKAGTILSRSDQTTASAIIDGTAQYSYEGTGAHTLLSVWGNSTAKYNGTGAVATLNQSGTVSRVDTRAVTFGSTAYNIYKGAKILLNNGAAASTTRSNKTFIACGIQDLTIELPVGEQF